jgi:hypothetical protein
VLVVVVEGRSIRNPRDVDHVIARMSFLSGGGPRWDPLGLVHAAFGGGALVEGKALQVCCVGFLGLCCSCTGNL